MNIVNPKIEKYAEEHTSPESEIVKTLVARSDDDLEHIDMLSGRVVTRLLAMLVRISGARRVLEVGTFTGYSALSMAEALPTDGELITCEYNKRYESIARAAFSDSEHGSKITLRMGKALETIDKLKGRFDLAFLDADKNNYPEYYRKLIPRLKNGALLIIDNVLWAGKVISPDDSKSHAIDRLNTLIANDDRTEQVMLTVRDGVTIVRKR